MEAQETEPTSLPPGYEPSPKDVLLGRGKTHWNHEGNAKYRKLIRSRVREHRGSDSKAHKLQIASAIVNEVTANGGRFIRKSELGWEDIGLSAALEKVEHSLRDQPLPSEDELEEPPLVEPEVLPPEYVPSSSDVHCGRGKKNWHHEGNAMFRELIRANISTYREASHKPTKNTIVISIVKSIRENGGRFIKQDKDSGRWHEIGDSQARDKVHHSLRDHVYIKSKKQEAKGTSKKSPPLHSQGAKRPPDQMASSGLQQEDSSNHKTLRVAGRDGRVVLMHGQPAIDTNGPLSSSIMDGQSVDHHASMGSINSQSFATAFAGGGSSSPPNNNHAMNVASQFHPVEMTMMSKSSSTPVSEQANPALHDELLASARRGDLAPPIEGRHLNQEFFLTSSSSRDSPPEETSSSRKT